MVKIKVEQIAKQIRGVSYKPEDLHDRLDDDSVILLRANNISDGRINFDEVVFVDKSKVSQEQYLIPGDILICASSGSKQLVGKAASVAFDKPCTFGAFCKVVRPKDGLEEYLGSYFQSEKYRKAISSLAIGANINNIRNEHINSLEIPLYSEADIQKIVSVSKKLLRVIDQRKAELNKLDELVKARFVEIFGDPRSNPRGYEKRELRSTCSVITGNTPSRSVSEYYGNYIEWIKTDNIVTGRMTPSSAVECLSESGLSVGRSVNEGAILMACIAGSIASIGRVCMTDRRVAFNQQINAVIPNMYDVRFLFVLLQISKDYLVEEINMALKGILSKTKLEEKLFYVPPMDLQKQFAGFFEQIDKSKSAIQHSLNKTQLLFDSLMQEYFG